jgi:hypothetical protein
MYLYFSYSGLKNKAVGFLKTTEIKSVELAFTHDFPQFLRFVLGGNDLNAYPGFNGQFSRPSVKVGTGSFLANAD